MRSLRSVGVDEQIAQHAGVLGRTWHRSHALSTVDLVIAATAQELGAKLATSNTGTSRCSLGSSVRIGPDEAVAVAQRSRGPQMAAGFPATTSDGIMPACPEATHCETTSCPSAPNSGEGRPGPRGRASRGAPGSSASRCSDSCWRVRRCRPAPHRCCPTAASARAAARRRRRSASASTTTRPIRRGMPCRCGPRRAASRSRLPSSPAATRTTGRGGLARRCRSAAGRLRSTRQLPPTRNPCRLTDRS